VGRARPKTVNFFSLKLSFQFHLFPFSTVFFNSNVEEKRFAKYKLAQKYHTLSLAKQTELLLLAFSELSGTLPITTFTMLVCFCKIVCTANVFHFQFSTFPTLFNINNLLSNLD
jgi:hypothetical protein